jgi:ABC-2 type transport system permease protein
MSGAVIRKTLRDHLVLILLLTFGIVLLEFAIVRMVIEIGKDLEQFRMWIARPLIQQLLHMALGADVLSDMSPTALATIGLAHPLLYVLSWSLLLTIGTAVIAGEIDRGTADLLLTLPMSRTTVYMSTTLVWVIAAVLASAASLPGLRLGQALWPQAPALEYGRLWPVCMNLLALNLAVGGITMFLSSVVSRRGRAIGIVLCGLLVSDLVNLLAQFRDAIKPLSFLGFVYYYKPLAVVRSGQLPLHDIGLLLAIGGVAWGFGWWYFVRRDIPAA